MNKCTLIHCFITSCATGYSSARLERYIWDVEAVSSNLAIPTVKIIKKTIPLIVRQTYPFRVCKRVRLS